MKKYKFSLEFTEQDLPDDEWTEQAYKDDPTLIWPLYNLFQDIIREQGVFCPESDITLKLKEYTDK